MAICGFIYRTINWEVQRDHKNILAIYSQCRIPSCHVLNTASYKYQVNSPATHESTHNSARKAPLVSSTNTLRKQTADIGITKRVHHILCQGCPTFLWVGPNGQFLKKLWAGLTNYAPTHWPNAPYTGESAQTTANASSPDHTHTPV